METYGHANGSTTSHKSRIPDLPEDRLPPQNLEAEQGVLGAILLDNSVLLAVAAILEPGDFYRDSNRIIYASILDLHGRGLPIDAIILSEELKRRDLYEKVGGDDFLADLLNGVPHAANAVYHAQIVAQKAKTRAAIELAGDVIRDGYSGFHTADAIFSRARERIDRIDVLRGPRPEIVEDVATLADVRRIIGEGEWVWRSWIVDGHMTVLAAEPGVGKTRLALDLCRRLWGALPWPDGEMATRPPGTCSLWVASDRHHSQLCQAARDMGLPDEAVRLNAPPVDPCGGLKLDDPVDVAALERRIRAVRPGLVVIDTINKATRRLLYRPEEAEAFFGPLLDIARVTRTPLLALTHLSKGGDPLDRRIEGTCRVMWRLERPDPAQVLRRKLWVSKSLDLYPPPLGVTMGTDGNDYDTAPPGPAAERAVAEPQGQAAPAAGRRGRPAGALTAAVEWLRDWLSTGPAICRTTIDAAEEAGHSERTFWRAVRALGVIRGGESPNQFFRLPGANEQPGEVEPDEDEERLF